MKDLVFTGKYRASIIRKLIIEKFPTWTTADRTFAIRQRRDEFTISVPDDTDEQVIRDIMDNYVSPPIIVHDIPKIRGARENFKNMPGWSVWTKEEAQDHIRQSVINGMSKQDLDTWIDGNVNTLPAAKNAIKTIGEELIDLREICTEMAEMILYLRDMLVQNEITIER